MGGFRSSSRRSHRKNSAMQLRQLWRARKCHRKLRKLARKLQQRMASNGSLIISRNFGRNISAAGNRRLSLKNGWQVKRKREPALASAETEELLLSYTSSSLPFVFQEVFGTRGLWSPVKCIVLS